MLQTSTTPPKFEFPENYQSIIANSGIALTAKTEKAPKHYQESDWD